MNKKLFWLENWNGSAKGGYYFRSFDLNKFMEKLEKEGHGKVVGLEFEDNNVNLIVEIPEIEIKKGYDLKKRDFIVTKELVN